MILFSSANIYPKPKENKLKNKIIVKIAERLVKKFNLNGGTCQITLKMYSVAD